MGTGTLPAADELGSQGQLFLAWVDTRNTPDGEIFFKRTDSEPPDPVSHVENEAQVCPDNDIQVSWEPPGDCDIKVYHVLASGPETVQVDVYPPDTSVLLPIPDTGDGTYLITVIVEDEACNLTETPVLVGVETPRCPELVEADPGLEVDCNGDPDNDGEPDPGETVSLTLAVENTGTAMATGVTGSLSVTAPATGVTVLAGDASYPDIDMGAAEVNDPPFRVQLAADVECPTTVELSLELSTEQEPASLSFSFDVGSNGCDSDCAPECDAANIQPIGLLQAAKLNGLDLELSWQQDPQALDGYNVWYIPDDKDQIPACEGCPGSQPVAGCQPTGGVAMTTCTHAGGIPGAMGEVFYYNVLGVCQGNEAVQ
jgi:hypothetical protein